MKKERYETYRCGNAAIAQTYEKIHAEMKARGISPRQYETKQESDEIFSEISVWLTPKAVKKLEKSLDLGYAKKTDF